MTKVKKGIIIGMMFLFVGSSIGLSISGNAGWTTYQHDITRNGGTDAVGAAYNWEEKFTYDIGDRVLSPVAGDLDGDGHMDAVFCSDVVGPNLPVYAVDLKTGDFKWSFMADSAVWSTPTLADLNDDTKLDVVFGAGSDDGHIYALYHDGTEMWSYFTGDSTNSIDGPSGIADVDGDGKPEVLVGGSCYYCPTCDTFFVLNGEDGSLLWGVNMGSTLTAPTIGEFDGDPGVEIVMGGYDGYVRVFDGEDGNEVWAVQPDASGWIESTPAIVDYGSDGVDDIVVFSGSDIYLLDGSNGDTTWSYPTAGSGLFGGISAGDIDEDGEPEILAYPYYTGLVYALNLDGTLKWTRDVGSDYTYASPSPAIVDIDGDTHPEVIVQARSSGILYALNGDTGNVENSFSLGTQSISSPAIADSDGDGIADIIVGCDDGKLYVIGNEYIEDWLDVNQPVFNRGFPIRHAVDGDWAAAQSFIPTLDTITGVDVYLRKFGTPEFDLTVELRTDNPQGALLDTVVFTPGEVASSWTWLNVDFTDVAVTPGTDYFIVCPPAPSGVTTSFGYEWGYAFGNQYDNGAFWFTRDGGTLWRDLPTMYEFTFRTYWFG